MEKKEIDKIPLIDGHAHLDELSDLSESLQEAKTAGVRGIIAVGMDVESNRKVLQIAEVNPGYVYPALGYHPWEIKEEEVEANVSFIRDHEVAKLKGIEPPDVAVQTTANASELFQIRFHNN